MGMDMGKREPVSLSNQVMKTPAALSIPKSFFGARIPEAELSSGGTVGMNRATPTGENQQGGMLASLAGMVQAESASRHSMVLWNHGASVPGSYEPPGNEIHGAHRLITVADWLAWVWEVRPDQGSVWFGR
jgi:hypothetical protein